MKAPESSACGLNTHAWTQIICWRFKAPRKTLNFWLSTPEHPQKKSLTCACAKKHFYKTTWFAAEHKGHGQKPMYFEGDTPNRCKIKPKKPKSSKTHMILKDRFSDKFVTYSCPSHRATHHNADVFKRKSALTVAWKRRWHSFQEKCHHFNLAMIK